MRTYIDIVSKVVDKIAAALTVFPWILAIMIVWEVGLRNIFNLPTIWVHELSSMVFGILIIMAGAYTLKMNAHINMDLFYGKLSERGKAIADICTFPLTAAFCIIIAVYGGEFAYSSLRVGETSLSEWHPVIWPVKIFLPLGAFVFLLQAIAKLFSDILTLKKG